MKTTDQHENAMDFAKDILKIIFIMGIWLIISFLIGSKNIKIFEENNKLIQIAWFLLGFGFVHWKFNEAVSNFYNLGRKVLFFSPKVTLHIVGRIGLVSTAIGIILLCVLIYRSLAG